MSKSKDTEKKVVTSKNADGVQGEAEKKATEAEEVFGAQVSPVSELDAPKKEVRSRVWMITQNVQNPRTGETLITEEQIKEGLEWKSVARWAYILHDKDVWTEEDEALARQRAEEQGVECLVRAGETKAPHYHVVIQTKSNSRLSDVARVFGVPPQCVEKKSGRGAFETACEYLTHEHPNQQEKGKHLYDDEEVQASFDFREVIGAFQERRANKMLDISPDEEFRHMLTHKGVTLAQAYRDYPVEVGKYVSVLPKLRAMYLKNCPLPRQRTNYLITGQSGKGKSEVAKLLAELLYPDHQGTVEELVFIAGNEGSALSGYDGQRVIIWDDYRGSTLVKTFKGLENFYRNFNNPPLNVTVDVKYGSTRLVNEINIVTTSQNAEEFYDSLHGFAVEDRAQAYRRFPLWIEVEASSIWLQVNRGFFDPYASVFEYEKVAHIKHNMREFVGKLGQLPEGEKERVRLEVGQKIFSRVVDTHNDYVGRFIKSVEELEGARIDSAQWAKENGFGEYAEIDSGEQLELDISLEHEPEEDYKKSAEYQIDRKEERGQQATEFVAGALGRVVHGNASPVDRQIEEAYRSDPGTAFEIAETAVEYVERARSLGVEGERLIGEFGLDSPEMALLDQVEAGDMEREYDVPELWS